MKFGDSWNDNTILKADEKMKNVFDNIINVEKKQHKKHDLIRIILRHQDLNNDIVIVPQPLSSISSSFIFNEIERVLNSYQEMQINKDIDVTIGIVNIPEGNQYKNVINLKRDLPNKKSIIQIRNKDNTCGYRSIVIGLAKMCKMSNEDYNLKKNENLTTIDNLLINKICNYDFYKKLLNQNSKRKRNELKNTIKILCEKVSHDITKPLKITDIPKFEDFFKININVIKNNIGNKFIYSRNDYEGDSIFLYLHDDHYDTIISI